MSGGEFVAHTACVEYAVTPRVVLQLLGVIVGIAGLLALLALAFYLLWRLAMIVVSFSPTIGKKHKHADWERLQKR